MRRRRRNPRHHHRRHRVNARRHHRRFRNARHHRRRLRNPRSGGGFSTRGLVHNTVVPAAIGATGALVLDVAYSYVSPNLPATFQTGWMAYLAKAAAALGLGYVGMRFLGRERGKVAMLGAFTVLTYSALRTATAGMGIPGLSGYSDYTPYPMGAYIKGPTGTPGIQGLGYVSPAAVIGPTMSPRMGAYMPSGAANVMGDYSDGM